MSFQEKRTDNGVICKSSVKFGKNKELCFTPYKGRTYAHLSDSKIALIVENSISVKWNRYRLIGRNPNSGVYCRSLSDMTPCLGPNKCLLLLLDEAIWKHWEKRGENAVLSFFCPAMFSKAFDTRVVENEGHLGKG